MAILTVKAKSILKSTKLGTYMRKRRWNKSITNEVSIRGKVAQRFPDKSAAEQEVIVKDILDMARKYRFSADEYFYYHFIDLPEEARASFLSDLNRIDFCERLNSSKNLYIFDDKSKCAELFGKYYRRDYCSIKSVDDIPAFKEFLKNHNKFIVKPIFGACGSGVKILEMQFDDENAIKQLFSEYCSGKKDGFIAEELIVQSPEMAQFHPSSINTIRVATVKYDDGVEVIASFFRMGRNGNIVDNAGAGGVFGTVDIDTGMIIAVGDEEGNSYTHHPNSGVSIVGFTIPKWEEAKTMAKELATIVKGNRYAAWDLALTDNGWVMVEGNARGQFVWQIPVQKGFLKEANSILKRLGLPEFKKLSI